MKRNYNIDFIKGFAMILVILAHSLPQELFNVLGVPFLSRQAVPIFMLIMGYNASKSFERRGESTFRELYAFKSIKSKVLKIVNPYLTYIVLNSLALLALGSTSFKNIIFRTAIGGFGPGYYFTLITIQAIFILPLIFKILDWKSKWTIPALFLGSLVIEVAVVSLGLPEPVFILLIVPYIFAMVLGIYLAQNEVNLNKSLIFIGAMLSVLYIIYIDYLDNIIYIEKYWNSRHTPSYFYTLLVVVLLLKIPSKYLKNKASSLVIKVGQISFDVFLMQMLYFSILHESNIQLPFILNDIIAVIICCILGLAFNKMNGKIMKILK